MKQRQVDKDYLAMIESNYAEYKADYETMVAALPESEAIYHDEIVPTLYMPRFFPDDHVDCIRDIVKTSSEIFHKVIDRYVADGQYREAFGFSPELEELIMLETDIPEVFPMARFDFHFDDCDHFSFIEINTDGSSAMVEDREFVRLFKDTKAYRDFSQLYDMKSFDLVGLWVEALKNIYQEQYQDELPTIAIVDFLEYENLEFIRFQKEFEKAGMPTFIGQPDELEYRDDGYLYYQDHKIDVVYRRLVTSDFMQRYDELGHLVEALKYGKTLWVGPIRTQIIHSKIFFAVLHREEFWPMFTPEEVAFIKKAFPYTEELTDDNRDDARFLNKDQWILKPTDSYASKGVIAGKMLTGEEWRKELHNNERGRTIIQKYSEIGHAKMINFDQDEVAVYGQMIGVFVYRNYFAGLYSRVGQQAIVAGPFEGRVVASFETKRRKD